MIVLNAARIIAPMARDEGRSGTALGSSNLQNDPWSEGGQPSLAAHLFTRIL